MVIDIITDKEALKAPCEAVKEGDMIAEITHNLIETAKFHEENGDAGCLGLSANQIGYNKRIFVVKINKEFIPLINPEIIKLFPGTVSKNEGCLSFPGKRRKINRHKRIRIAFNDYRNAKRLEFNFKGVTARCILHELDHLNGVHI